MTPGINVDNLGTGGGTATVAGIKDLAASNAQFTSGTVSITEAGEGITVNTAASKIRISGAQTGVKNLYGGTDGPFSSGTVSVSALGEGLTINTAASKLQISASQTGVKNLVASGNNFSSGTVSITGAGDITVATSASGIIVSGTSQSVQTQSTGSAVSLSGSEIPIAGFGASNTATLVASHALFQRLPVDAHLSVDRIGVLEAMTSFSSNSTGSIRIDVGLYTRNASSLSSLATSSYTTSWTSNSTTNNDWLAYSGTRRHDVPFASSLTPGEYWLAVQHRGKSAFSGNAVGVAPILANAAGASVTAANTGGSPFGVGIATASISNNAAFAGSDISISVGGVVPYVYLRNSNGPPW